MLTKIAITSIMILIGSFSPRLIFVLIDLSMFAAAFVSAWKLFKSEQETV